MKLIASLILTLSAASAFAGIKVYPNLQFTKAAAWVKATNVCVDGNDLVATLNKGTMGCSGKDKAEGACTPNKGTVRQPMVEVSVKCVQNKGQNKECFINTLEQGPVVYGMEYSNWKAAENGYNGTPFAYVLPNCDLQY